MAICSENSYNKGMLTIKSMLQKTEQSPLIGFDPKYQTPIRLGQDCSIVNVFDMPAIGFYTVPSRITIGNKEIVCEVRDVPVYLGDYCSIGLDMEF